jgi:hypothetical protein
VRVVCAYFGVCVCECAHMCVFLCLSAYVCVCLCILYSCVCGCVCADEMHSIICRFAIYSDDNPTLDIAQRCGRRDRSCLSGEHSLVMLSGCPATPATDLA